MGKISFQETFDRDRRERVNEGRIVKVDEWEKDIGLEREIASVGVLVRRVCCWVCLWACDSETVWPDG